MQCAYHPDREPVGACVSCGRLICVECKALLGGKIYCTPCADKNFVQNKGEVTKVETPPPAIQAQPVSSQGSASKLESVSTSASSNTSGQVSATLPPELKGWNWGAFFLTWIWGIGNGVWIAFIALILGLIWSIVLGIKGNEWAWQHKKWNSVEHFKKTQKKWAKWGIGLFIVSIVITILWIVIVVVLGFLGYSVKLGS
jgi:hypothetical protein